MGIFNSKCKQPYIGQEFYDTKSAKKFYQAYAINTGFIVREERPEICKTSRGILAQTFACDYLGCHAKMSVGFDCYMANYRVYWFTKSHNHPLNPTPKVPTSQTTEADLVKRPGKMYEFMRQNEALVRDAVDNVEIKGEHSIEILSSEPRVVLYRNFLSKKECEHLINLGKSNVVRSCVTDSKTDQPNISSSCPSFGKSLRRRHDIIVSNIEARIAKFTCVPKGHGGGLSFLHYEIGEKSDPHHDYTVYGNTIRNGGQRVVTFLMYLSDVEEGGETIFPYAKQNATSTKWSDDKSHWGKSCLVVKPKMGDALLIWGLKPDGTLDSSSIHGSRPVTVGTKWTCTQLMHVAKFRLIELTTSRDRLFGDRLLMSEDEKYIYK